MFNKKHLSSFQQDFVSKEPMENNTNKNRVIFFNRFLFLNVENILQVIYISRKISVLSWKQPSNSREVESIYLNKVCWNKEKFPCEHRSCVSIQMLAALHSASLHGLGVILLTGDTFHTIPVWVRTCTATSNKRSLN